MNDLEILAYCDFWDVPRWFVVEAHGVRYLFDCPFDEELDDYPDTYSVGRVPFGWVLPGDAIALAAQVEPLGTVPVEAVRFDATRRRSIQADALKRLTAR